MNIQKSSHRCTQQLTFQWQTTESNAHLPTENKRNQRLFTIYICKPVGSQLGQMVSKIRDWSISSRTAFTICKNQFHLPKSPRRRETGIQGSFEEMEPEFSFETFRPKKKKKQDYLIRCSVAPGNFPPERPKKSCSIYFPTGFSGYFLYKVNSQPFRKVSINR